MKILAFTDIHGSLSALKKIAKKVESNKIDLLVCAGDISMLERNILSIVKKLNKLNKKIIIVHGNHEDSKTIANYAKLFKNIIFIHKNYAIEDNTLFLGYGGGGFSLIDKEFDKTATKFKKLIINNNNKKIVLVTHAPPYKTKLDKLVGGYCGNKSIRKFVEKNKIDLVVCGHLHENFGKDDMIKKTKIINPSPFGKIVIV